MDERAVHVATRVRHRVLRQTHSTYCGDPVSGQLTTLATTWSRDCLTCDHAWEAEQRRVENAADAMARAESGRAER